MSSKNIATMIKMGDGVANARNRVFPTAVILKMVEKMNKQKIPVMREPLNTKQKEKQIKVGYIDKAVYDPKKKLLALEIHITNEQMYMFMRDGTISLTPNGPAKQSSKAGFTFVDEFDLQAWSCLA